MRDVSHLPAELREDCGWTLARHDKAPLTLDGSLRRGAWWDQADPLDAVLLAQRDRPDLLVGVVFPSDRSIVGVDFDDVRDEATGWTVPWAEELIEELDCAAEVSTSGGGFHLYARGPKTWDLPCVRNGLPGVSGTTSARIEVYDHGRYFVVGSPYQIRPLGDAAALELIRLRFFADADVGVDAPEGDAAEDHEPIPADLDELLAFIPADQYAEHWLPVGMALRLSFGDAAFEHWHRWSQKSDKYDGPHDCRRKWDSFRRQSGEVVSYGSVVHLARRHGWQPGGTVDPEAVFADEHRPRTIRLHAGSLGPATTQAEAALLEAQAAGRVGPVYQRDRELVRVAVLAAAERDRGAVYAAGTPVVLPMDPSGVMARFEAAAEFERFDKRSKKWHRTDCPSRVATHFLNRAGDWRVPVLRGIARTPIIRNDGSIAQVEGYDAASGLWLDFGGAAFPEVPDRPGLDQARAAIETLTGPASLFPWCSDADRAVWLSCLLTAVCRHTLPTAPMFLFDSPVRGSGKTVLASLAGIIGTGALPVTMPPAPDDDEMRKRLFAVLRRGGGCILIDNVEAPLEGASLCATLTQEAIEDRVLGESRIVAVPTTVTLMATGNNVRVKGDIVRRVLRCRIDPQVEYPELRRFDFDPLDRARRDRPALVTAALTLLRAHGTVGRPQAGVGPLGSFESWSRIVRAALVWAGEADPCAGRQGVLEDDGDLQALQELFQAWWGRFEDQAVKVGEVVRVSEDDRLVRAVNALVADAASAPKALGRRLQRESGRVLGGLRIVVADRREGQIRWRAERLEG